MMRLMAALSNSPLRARRLSSVTDMRWISKQNSQSFIEMAFMSGRKSHTSTHSKAGWSSPLSTSDHSPSLPLTQLRFGL